MRLRTLVDPLGLTPVVLGLGGRAATSVVQSLIRGPLIDIAVRTALEEGVIERVSAELLESGAVDRIVDHALSTPLPEHVADRLLAAGVAERVVERVVAGPELERLITTALDSPRMAELSERALESEGMERLVAQVLDSHLVDASVARILASEELWLVVDEIAQSPAVTTAISRQSVGFADQVAVDVGERSRRADARLERVARRLLRRPPAPDDPSATVLDPKPL